MFGTFLAERTDRKPLYGLNAQVSGCIMSDTGLGCQVCCVSALILRTHTHYWSPGPALPTLQPVPQGTFNPLWHQVHHFVATVRLAASGKVRGQLHTLGPCQLATFSQRPALAHAGCQPVSQRSLNQTVPKTTPTQTVLPATSVACLPPGYRRFLPGALSSRA